MDAIKLSAAEPISLGAYVAQGTVLTARLTASAEDPKVEFYDGSKLVASYYLATLLKHLLLNPDSGLCLWADVPAWTLPAESTRQLATVLGSHISRW